MTPISATPVASRNSVTPARISAPPTSMNGRGRFSAERQDDSPESFQLRPLQDLRHHGSLRDHHLGPARRWRRPKLRWDVESAISIQPKYFTAMNAKGAREPGFGIPSFFASFAYFCGEKAWLN